MGSLMYLSELLLILSESVSQLPFHVKYKEARPSVLKSPSFLLKTLLLSFGIYSYKGEGSLNFIPWYLSRYCD